jgi:integrase
VKLPAFMADLRGQQGIAARALEFTILTAARTGETVGARWSEIDFTSKRWTVPARRMKAGKEHIVPLAPRGVRILEATRPIDWSPDNFIFHGARLDRPLSNMALLMLLRRMGHGDVTTHGFRSTFSDWVGDRTNFDQQTREFALAHGINDKTEAAYRRATAVDKRRRMMAVWAEYCASKAATDETKVISLRSAYD